MQEITFKTACEAIFRWLEAERPEMLTKNRWTTPKDIFAASPDGGLFHVWELYEATPPQYREFRDRDGRAYIPNKTVVMHGGTKVFGRVMRVVPQPDGTLELLVDAERPVMEGLANHPRWWASYHCREVINSADDEEFYRRVWGAPKRLEPS